MPAIDDGSRVYRDSHKVDPDPLDPLVAPASGPNPETGGVSERPADPDARAQDERFADDLLGPLVLPAETAAKDLGQASVVCWNDAMVPVQPFVFVADAEGVLTGGMTARPLLQPPIDDWLW